MEILHNIRNIFKPTFAIMLIIVCSLNALSAIAEEYQLEVLAQLPTLSGANNIAIIPLPIESNKKNQYLIANETGELSILNGSERLSLTRLPLSDQTANQQVRLTALVLHPSFSLADQTGYQTFFTAHIEPTKTNNNFARLTLLENPTPLPFDAVITQWQYDNTAPKIIDVKQRREVLRIAVPTATHQIQKIAFNPYNKAWHDDYGLLHIALSESKTFDVSTKKAPLYSGVILRINPKRFGLRNYRVPSSNPFVKTSDINNEIFILGAENIKSFSWSKEYYDALLIQHIHDGAHKVAVAKKGTDWREAYQNKLVFPLKLNQAKNAKILQYRGRKLKTLVGSILYLSKDKLGWQLAKLNTAFIGSKVKDKTAVEIVEPFNNEELPLGNKVSLLFDHAGEPLLLDSTKKQLLSINTHQLVTENNNNVEIETAQDEHPSSIYDKLLLGLFTLILAAIFYRLRPKSNTAEAKLRSQFARFELDDTQTTLSLYKRHQTEIDRQLAIADIVKSEVFLNDKNVNKDHDHDHGYSEQRENQIRLSFFQAHRQKLIEDEIRQVNLSLTDKNAKTHIVCLYLRKGNQRLTKEKYLDTLETIIDWNWFIASQLNPEATEIRKAKVPVAKSVVQNIPSKPQENSVIKQEQEIVKPNSLKKTSAELHDIAEHDSELINALDKLVNLKQQGFLTDEEFSLAKAKILLDMTSNK
jgi:hypothetical protein